MGIGSTPITSNMLNYISSISFIKFLYRCHKICTFIIITNPITYYFYPDINFVIWINYHKLCQIFLFICFCFSLCIFIIYHLFSNNWKIKTFFFFYRVNKITYQLKALWYFMILINACTFFFFIIITIFCIFIFFMCLISYSEYGVFFIFEKDKAMYEVAYKTAMFNFWFSVSFLFTQLVLLYLFVVFSAFFFLLWKCINHRIYVDLSSYFKKWFYKLCIYSLIFSCVVCIYIYIVFL